MAKTDSVRIYEKNLADGSKAVGLFNVGSTTAAVNVDFLVVGLNGEQKLRHLWR